MYIPGNPKDPLEHELVDAATDVDEDGVAGVEEVEAGGGNPLPAELEAGRLRDAAQVVVLEEGQLGVVLAEVVDAVEVGVHELDELEWTGDETIIICNYLV